MPSSIKHIAVGLLLGSVFIFGVIFPDGEFIFQKDFFKTKQYWGFFSKKMIARETSPEQFKEYVLHKWYVPVILCLFSLGWLLHICMDYVEKIG